MSNLEVFRGDTKTYNLTFTDGDGAAVDLNGSTVFFTVKKSFDNDVADDEALIVKTVTSHDDATSGLSSFSLTTTDTNITPGSYFYDLQLKDSSNSVTTILQNDFVIRTDVTRREE